MYFRDVVGSDVFQYHYIDEKQASDFPAKWRAYFEGYQEQSKVYLNSYMELDDTNDEKLWRNRHK
jgi:hypothetical protein